ncbi:hypothetical protein MHYP_G00172870 [Metynnis hypsauchen]
MSANLLLPHLLPPSAQGRNWPGKMSASQAVDQLIRFQKVGTSVQQHLDSITQSSQPYLLALGSTKSSIHSYFVVIDKHALPCKATGSVGAFDELFKAHFAFEQEANNQPLENVELTMTTEQLMNIDLDETEDSMEQHLGDEMFEATLTEAEVEAVKQLMLLFIDQIEAESLGSEVMNVPDTEPEAQVETYLDEVDTPNDLPLEEEILEVMDTEDEAEVSKDRVHLELHDTETEYLGKN